MTTDSLEHLNDDDVVLDSLPEDVVASLEVKDHWFAGLPPGSSGEEFVIVDLQRWPMSTVRVAFLDGTAELHSMVAEASRPIVEACNLDLDFGHDESSGSYRRWSETDTEYSAEIRVSFDQGGYWSLVGTDSINGRVGGPDSVAGGRPRQRSLNLGGFDENAMPPFWEGTVRHELLHALGFKHEHQNIRGPCEADFRWEDDPGYQATQDAVGRYVEDSAGRRPGIYTYLAGYPNHWSRATVTHNLRTVESPDVTAGPFDRASIMLYRFDASFYKSSDSTCTPTGDRRSLSEGDVRALRLMYPPAGPDLETIETRRGELLETVSPGPGPELPGAESSTAEPSDLQREATKILQWNPSDG